MLAWKIYTRYFKIEPLGLDKANDKSCALVDGVYVLVKNDFIQVDIGKHLNLFIPR